MQSKSFGSGCALTKLPPEGVYSIKPQEASYECQNTRNDRRPLQSQR